MSALRAERVRGGDRDQHEAGLRDRRVGEQALDVPLRERGDVADRERGDRDPGDRPRPELLVARERRHEHPVGDDERHHLRRRAHERGHRRRRALVDVGRPHVERRRRGLEREPGDDHRQPEHEQRVVRVPGGGDRVEAELAGRAVDERRAEEQHRRADAPMIRYLSPASSEPTRSMSIAHRT